MKLENSSVTQFLDQLHHPLRKEIEQLRKIILEADSKLDESIKWNGPNYSYHGEDRITMKIMPPKQIQLVFHRGAKKLEQPANRIIDDPSGLLSWRENDRAITSFKSMDEVEKAHQNLKSIIVKWIAATS